MTKAILFDFGGTLDTDGVHWSEKFWDKYQLLSIPITKQCYEEAYVYAEKNVSDIIKINDNLKDTLVKQIKLQAEYLTYRRKLLIVEKHHFIEKISSACYKDVLQNIEIVKNILEHLSKSYKLGIVSNFYGNLHTVLSGLRILKYFDVIIDSKVVNIKKPDLRIFKKAILELDVNPSNTIVIGDSYDRDIKPAKYLGCKTIWLDGRSWSRPDNVKDVDIIIHSIINDLLSLFD